MTGLVDVMTEPNRANYMTVPLGRVHSGLLACLGCGTVILDDQHAIEMHATLHYLMNRWATAADTVLP